MQLFSEGKNLKASTLELFVKILDFIRYDTLFVIDYNLPESSLEMKINVEINTIKDWIIINLRLMKKGWRSLCLFKFIQDSNGNFKFFYQSIFLRLFDFIQLLTSVHWYE